MNWWRGFSGVLPRCHHARPEFAAIRPVASYNDLRWLLGRQDGTGRRESPPWCCSLLRLLALPTAGMTDLSRGAELALGDSLFQNSADLYFAAAARRPPGRDALTALLRGRQGLAGVGQPLLAFQAARRERCPARR